MRVVKAIKLRLTSKINHCFKKKLTLGLSTSCMQSLEKKQTNKKQPLTILVNRNNTVYNRTLYIKHCFFTSLSLKHGYTR